MYFQDRYPHLRRKQTPYPLTGSHMRAALDPRCAGARFKGMNAAGHPILVVDDDPMIGDLLAEALKKAGYVPAVYNHPEEALRVAKGRVFGLAFIDIDLPDMDGLELARRLKRRDPLCEVVFITGHGSFDYAVQAIKIGANDYLRKPFGIHEFTLCLRRFEERQTLREKARLAEERYFQLVQSLPLIIFVLSRDLRLDFINGAVEGILGFNRDEVTGLSDWFFGRFHEEDRERVMRGIEEAFQKGSPFSMECRLLHRDGRQIHTILQSIHQPIRDEGPGMECLEGFIVDITDRVFLERTLVQREKLKTLGAISAEVAHEIRNPLVAIGGFARRLHQKLPDLRETGVILRECQRLEKILRRIRDYLKPVEIHPRQCRINEMVEECLELLSPEVERRMISCRPKLAPGLPAVYVDPEILTQILINLLRNGMESMGEKETLEIRTYERDRNVHVDFRNRAQTRVIKDPEALFMPFAEGGQSIGLPLCYRLLKDIGGVLSFVQEKGFVIFTVSLPKMTGEKDMEGETP